MAKKISQHQQVVLAAIEQANKLLKASGVDYKIITKDGKSYGNLRIPKMKSTQHRLPRGTFTNLIRPYLTNMAVGDVAQIPAAPGVSINHFRTNVAFAAFSMWGAGAHKTAVAGNSIEVLRTA